MLLVTGIVFIGVAVFKTIVLNKFRVSEVSPLLFVLPDAILLVGWDYTKIIQRCVGVQNRTVLFTE